MSPTDTLTADPAAEAEDSLSASPEESASQPEPPADDDISPESRAQMNDLIRGLVGQVQTADSTSKPGDADDEDDVVARDGESAPSGDVKPSDQSGQPGRRGAAAEIKRLQDENARLQQALDAANPPPPDASEEARNAAIARERRFRDLNGRASDDPVLYQQGADGEVNADWLDAEKKRRALVPEYQQHYETVLAADRQALQDDFDGRVTGFQNYVLAGMEAVKGLPGVDFEAVKAAPDFRARELLIANGSYEAGRASSEPELKKLREEVAELKRDLLGATRAPVNGGRSSPGRTYSENDLMNTLIRGGRV